MLIGISRSMTIRVTTLGAAIWIALGHGLAGASRAAAAEAEAAGWLARAALTQAATRSRLRVLGDAETCAEARFVSYPRSDFEPTVVNQWYVVSQLWADAALLRAGAAGSRMPVAQTPRTPGPPRPVGSDESEARCHLDKGFVFLDRLWDHHQGGYYPHADPTGLQVGRDARFADDNALAGLALLATAETVRESAPRQRYVHGARREAEFLTTSGLWDATFGGGFWWNTNRGGSREGKPAQTNALAAIFFARLYHTTGDPDHREWALRTLLWLDTILYDPSRQLYRWSVSHEDLAGRTGAVINSRYFNYGQGLAVEAEVLAFGLDADANRLCRARATGEALHRTFWEPQRGGYSIEAENEDVYTAYAAWTSLGHLALYDVDGDRRWLDLARANADAVEARLGLTGGGYGLADYICPRPDLPQCERDRVRWVRDGTRDLAAQAWMQHLQTAIARRLLAPRV